MEASVDQLKTDLVRVENLLRIDIHRVDEKVDILNIKVESGLESMHRHFSAIESNLATLSAQQAGFEQQMESFVAKQDTFEKSLGILTDSVAQLIGSMRLMEANIARLLKS